MSTNLEVKKNESNLNLGIDFSKTNEAIKNLSTVVSELDDVFKTIESNTEQLKEYWEEKTSKEVFDSFDAYYKHLKEIKQNLESDIVFLKKKVVDSYIDSISTNKKQSDKLDVK